jgi:hypothetical protein
VTVRTREHEPDLAVIDRQPPNPWTQPRFVLAAAVVLLLAVMGLVAALLGGGRDQATSPGPAPAGTPATAATSRPATDSVCGLPAGSQLVPSDTLETQWELVGTVAAPTAPRTLGPGVVRGGLRSCFAHSPTGALYAAANILALTSDPGKRQTVIQQLATDGSSKDRALEALATEGPQADSGTRLQIAGYAFMGYTPSQTTIDLATRVSTGPGLGHIAMALTWRNGDWKLALAPDGRVSAALGPIPDMAGYVPWSGA